MRFEVPAVTFLSVAARAKSLTYLSIEALRKEMPGHAGQGMFLSVPQSDASLALPSQSMGSSAGYDEGFMGP